METPMPDPTERTMEISQREFAHLERRMLDQVGALKEAQEKFEQSITRVPTEVDRAIYQLRELMETRIEANAKLAAELAKASDMAIGKTERFVEERLREMGTLFRSETGSLNEKIQANLRRLDQFESRAIGLSDARTSSQDSQKLWIALSGVLFTFVVGFISLVMFMNRPAPPPEVRVIERQAGPSTVIDRPNQVVVPEGP